MISTVKELKKYLETVENIPKDFKIAVGCLIFTPENKVILLKRGQKARDSWEKLEGVGGEVEVDENDLIVAVQREIKEEIGEVEVEIEKILMIKMMPGDNNSFWVVVDYLGKLKQWIPKIMELKKIEEICYLNLDEIKEETLSEYQKVTMKKYKELYGNEVYWIKL